MTVAGVSRVLARAPGPLLLVTCAGTVEAASDAAARVVEVEDGAALVGTDVSAYTPAEPARHRLQDVADGTVEAAFARIPLVTSTGRHVTASASWRKVVTDEGLRVLVALTPVPLTRAVHVPFEQGRLPLLTTDHDWRVVDVSSDTVEGAGGTEQLRGHGLLGYVHPLDLGEVLSALAVLGPDVHAVTVRARVRRADAWELLQVTFARLCSHEPPRLACLLAPVHPSEAPERELDALLRDRDSGQLLAHVSRAVDRLATKHDLSAQDLEIIARSLRGESPRTIAQGMYLSQGTVRNALSALYRKFGVHTHLELVSAVLHAT